MIPKQESKKNLHLRKKIKPFFALKTKTHTQGTRKRGASLFFLSSTRITFFYEPHKKKLKAEKTSQNFLILRQKWKVKNPLVIFEVKRKIKVKKLKKNVPN